MAFADDYVPVNERIEAFYSAHPEGSIQCEIHTLTTELVVVQARAYRTADDVRPGIAHSMLTIPGKTNFTRGSEVENAETSAVGRAIAMLGFEVKRGMSSRDEVRNKSGEHGQELPPPPRTPERDLSSEADLIVWEEFTGQCKALGIGMKPLCAALGHDATSPTEGAEWLSNHGAKALKEWLEANPDLNWNNLVSRLADQKAAR